MSLSPSEAELRALVDATGAGISVWVPREDGHFAAIFRNESAAHLSGIPTEDVLGRCLHDAGVAPSVADRAEAAMREALAHGRVIDHDAVSLDGGRRLAIRITPLVGEDGERPRVVAALRDVTAERSAAVAADEAEQRRLVEDRLRTSEERYASLVAKLTDAVFQTGADGRLSFLNPAWETLTGASVSASVGRPLTDFVHPEDRDIAATTCDAWLRGEHTRPRVSLRFVRADGDVRWVEVAAQSSGTAPGVQGVIVDVSERVMAERRLNLQYSLLTSLADGSREGQLIVNDASETLWLNRRFAELWGLDWDVVALLGADDRLRTVMNLVVDPVAFRDRVVELSRDTHTAAVDDIALRDGRTVERYTAPAFDTDGVRFGRAWYFRDVTAERRAAAEIAARAVALGAARDAALEATRLKSAFLANVSHEIRTPMNATMGMLELLLHTTLTPEQREYADTARSSSDLLLTLINDILDVSKIEAGRLDLDLVESDVRDTVHKTVDLLAGQARRKGITLSASVPAGPVRGRTDLVRLRQILTNLVSNAVKFTDHGGVVVSVEEEGSPGPGHTARFAVRDTGIGIPRDAQDRLFEAFTQADSSITRRYGGTGLGLSICRSLVELLGGEIGVESAPGTGSTFWFRVPLHHGAYPAPPSERPSATAAAAPGADPATIGRILVAEDNPVNLRVVLAQLELLGYEADAAQNGREALAAIAARPYALVLMDCQMPELDGISATAELRRREAGTGRRVPVLALTANAMQEDRDRCIAAGMDDFLTKPLPIETLRDTIDRWVPGRSAPRAPTPASDGAIQGRDVLDPLVLDRLGALDAGRGAVQQEVIGLFLAAMPGWLRALDASVRSGEWDRVQRAAHRLRSGCANVGAAALASLFEALERSAAAGEPEASAALAGEVELAYLAAADALRVAMSGPDSPSNA